MKNAERLGLGQEKLARPIKFHKRAHRARSRGGHLGVIGIMSPQCLNNNLTTMNITLDNATLLNKQIKTKLKRCGALIF